MAAVTSLTFDPWQEEERRATTLVASSSSDGTIKFLSLQCHPDHTMESQWFKDLDSLPDIHTPSQYALCLSLTLLPHVSYPLLATGTTRNTINIYLLHTDGTQSDTASSIQQPISASTTEIAASPIAFQRIATFKGHAHWVRDLAFTTTTTACDGDRQDILLASASMDRYIRLWRLTLQPLAPAASTNPSVVDTLSPMQRLKDTTQATLYRWTSRSGDGWLLRMFCESVLTGHDHWVLSVRWAVQSQSNVDTSTSDEELLLVSASADKSCIVWSPPPKQTALTEGRTVMPGGLGVWLEAARVGSLGGLSSFAFWSADLLVPNQPLEAPSMPEAVYPGMQVLAIGTTGAFHRWQAVSHADGLHWRGVVGHSGHTQNVRDACWSPDGRYFLTTSFDQTTRLFAPRHVTTCPDTQQRHWYEVARPQVHGYDCTAVQCVTPHLFVGGADEKVVRVFRMPRQFLQGTWQGLLGYPENSIPSTTGDTIEGGGVGGDADAATVPALGLSNKATFSTASTTSITAKASMTTIDRSCIAPLEHHLNGGSLWPEIETLYGHPYELHTIAVTHDARTVATACRSNTAQHAAVLLWDMKALGRPMGVLPQPHGLTVTRLAFSPDDRYLVTVSRDRHWHLYARGASPMDASSDGGWSFRCHAKAHNRIIWDVAWVPCGTAFLTVSRDRKVKLWRFPSATPDDVNETFPALALTHDMEESVTSVAVTNHPRSDEGQVVALGLATGAIQLYLLQLLPTDPSTEAQALTTTTARMQPMAETALAHAHAGPVTRLAFRPKASADGGDTEELLLSVGEDGSTRLFPYVDVVQRGLSRTTVLH